MNSTSEKFVKRKIEKLDKAFLSIIDLNETELKVHGAINGHMKHVREILKEVLEEVK